MNESVGICFDYSHSMGVSGEMLDCGNCTIRKNCPINKRKPILHSRKWAVERRNILISNIWDNLYCRYDEEGQEERANTAHKFYCQIPCVL